MGHFDLVGFMMNKGVESKYHSRDSTFLHHYSNVFSGHFHTRSANNNISYIGSPYEMNWNDYDDARGFAVFDTVTRTTEYIDNLHTIFKLIVYNNGCTIDKCDNKIIKMVVKSRDNAAIYEHAVSELNNRAIDLKIIIEDELDLTDNSHDETKEQLNTRDYLLGWVDRLDITDKKYIKSKLHTLFERVGNGSF
jgi:DNA repair exonuclease SbcCD nuclease subunit